MKFPQTGLAQSAIIAQMNKFIDKYGASNCYVGITEHVEDRLGFHKVYEPINNHLPPRLCFEASSEDVARDIEKHFLDLGCDGGDGGGNTPTFVYIYEIQAGRTVER